MQQLPFLLLVLLLLFLLGTSETQTCGISTYTGQVPFSGNDYIVFFFTHFISPNYPAAISALTLEHLSSNLNINISLGVYDSKIVTSRITPATLLAQSNLSALQLNKVTVALNTTVILQPSTSYFYSLYFDKSFLVRGNQGPNKFFYSTRNFGSYQFPYSMEGRQYTSVGTFDMAIYSPCFACYNVSNADPMVCSGHGICSSHNNCTCATGYSGDTCNVAGTQYCNGIASTNSSSVCSGNGQCVAADTCVCNAGYQGSDCSVRLPTVSLDAPTSASGHAVSLPLTIRVQQAVSYAGEVLKYQWIVSNGNGNVTLRYPNDLITPDLNGPVLSIKPNVLDAGSTYTFKLLASDSRGQGVATASVYINRAPHSGSCSVSPTSGIPFVTQFSFSCSFWADDTGTLSYRFSYIDGDMNTIVLNGDTSQATFAAAIPADGLMMTSVEAKAEVVDEAGNVVTVPFTIQFTDQLTESMITEATTNLTTTVTNYITNCDMKSGIASMVTALKFLNRYTFGSPKTQQLADVYFSNLNSFTAYASEDTFLHQSLDVLHNLVSMISASRRAGESQVVDVDAILNALTFHQPLIEASSSASALSKQAIQTLDMLPWISKKYVEIKDALDAYALMMANAQAPNGDDIYATYLSFDVLLSKFLNGKTASTSTLEAEGKTYNVSSIVIDAPAQALSNSLVTTVMANEDQLPPEVSIITLLQGSLFFAPDTENQTLATPIISITVVINGTTHPIQLDIQNPLTITFPGSYEVANTITYSCVTWNANKWDSEGCTTSSATASRVTCKCTQGKDFAVLVDVDITDIIIAFGAITMGIIVFLIILGCLIVCCIVIVIAVVVIIIIVALTKKQRKRQNTVVDGSHLQVRVTTK